MSLPGCGAEGGCSLLAESAWGNWGGWPLSFVGLAYFAALTAAWCLQRRGVFSRITKWVIRAGLVFSCVLLGVMFSRGQWCAYCVAIHLANLIVLLSSETQKITRESPEWRPIVAATGTFAAVSLVLGGIHLFQERSVEQQLAAEAEESRERVLAAAQTPQLDAGNVEATPRTSTPAVPASPSDSEAEVFRGRYRLGPERARMRIVAFADYQCGDCRFFDETAERLLRERDDVAFSLKHFPFCTDCNHRIQQNRHPNACRAALAAEAAGILAGEEGFWRLHHWLLSRQGTFTDEELRAALPGLGFANAEEFLDVMQGPETLRRVRADIDEALALGIVTTPFIFINGVEFKGWQTPGALQATAKALAEANAEFLTAAADEPMSGLERHFLLWKNFPAVELPRPAMPWTRGPDDAHVRILLMAEHASPESREASQLLRDIAGEYPSVQLVFRHFPLSKAFNPALKDLPQDPYPESLPRAVIAQAAGMLAGNDAFWAAHAWLLEHEGTLNIGDVREFSARQKIDADVLLAKMKSPEVQRAIRDDVLLGLRASMRWAPKIAINGRPVSGWRSHPGVVRRIVEYVLDNDSGAANGTSAERLN